MNGCIYEFKCNTRICMLHSIWCINVCLTYIEKFKAYYYKKKQKQSLIIPITAFCGRVIFYTRECQKQQILYYHETQHQNNL